MAKVNPQVSIDRRINDIQVRLGEILQQYGGMESNVPAVTYEYWALKNELVVLRAAKKAGAV